MTENRQSPGTWFPLYAQDWLGDPELAACSLAAQGLLMRLMCAAWPRGGTMSITRQGIYALCHSSRTVVERALEELKESNRITVEADDKSLTVSIPRLMTEATQATERYRQKSERGRNNVMSRWAKRSGADDEGQDPYHRNTTVSPPYCDRNTAVIQNDTTIQYNTVQDKTETCLSRISNTIAADDEPETPTTSQPEVSEVEVNVLESLLTQSFSGWMDLLQKTGRPHKIIMATPSQRRWWFTLKDIGSQMIGQWPTTAQGARDGLQRLIDVVAAKPDVLHRYINAPHFLKSDWPQMVEAVTPVKVWTDHDEQLAKAAVAAMMERRDKICRLASQE